MNLADYYTKHFPRKNLLTGDLLPFKNKADYFDKDFSTYSQLLKWCHRTTPENAKKLLEFLTSPNSQRWYAKVNNEYPVDPKVEASQILKNWGDFKSDSLPVDTLGKLNREPVKAMDKAGCP